METVQAQLNRTEPLTDSMNLWTLARSFASTFVSVVRDEKTVLDKWAGVYEKICSI